MKRLMLISLLFVLVACKNESNKDITMIVASEEGMCNIVGDFPCFIVKFSENEPWRKIPESIQGFDYVPGYEYVIVVEREVMENPPMDYPGKYFLKEVVSKTKKDSENLPE